MTYLYAKAIHNKVNFGDSKNIKGDVLNLMNVIDQSIQQNPNNSELYAFKAFVGLLF